MRLLLNAYTMYAFNFCFISFILQLFAQSIFVTLHKIALHCNN